RTTRSRLRTLDKHNSAPILSSWTATRTGTGLSSLSWGRKRNETLYRVGLGYFDCIARRPVRPDGGRWRNPRPDIRRITTAKHGIRKHRFAGMPRSVQLLG